jgi:hypothetical protein
MIVTKCIIRFATHSAVISVDDSGVIHIFKHTERSCDFDVFDAHSQFQAGDYALAPLEDCYYYVSFDDEPGPNP